MASPLRIGLTGGIGSGKSTVSELFEKLGVPIIDSDVIAHTIQRKGEKTYQKIVKEFGVDILDEQGELNRGKLRERVFNNPEEKKLLESIVHPEVRNESRLAVSRITHPYCILSIPLLVESSLEKTVDRVLVVDIPESMQIHRASIRDNVDEGNIRNIIANQATRENRLKVADDVIVNDQDENYLVQQVEKLDKLYKELAESMYNTEIK